MIKLSMPDPILQNKSLYFKMHGMKAGVLKKAICMGGVNMDRTP